MTPQQAVAVNRRYWQRVAMDRNRWLAASDGREWLARLRAGGTTLLEGEPASDGSRGEAELLSRLNGARLLHVGCGPGYESLSWANLGARVVSVDLAEENLAEAGRLAQAVDRKLLPVAADALRLPLRDNSFSAAYVAGLIQWIPDLHTLFAELYRVLRRAGRLLVVEEHPLQMVLDDERDPPVPRYRYEDGAGLHINSMDRAAWPMPPGTTLDTADYLWTTATLVTALLQAGFELRKLLEPRWNITGPTVPAIDGSQTMLPTVLVVLAVKPA